MSRNNANSEVSFCLKKGVKVYPVRQKTDKRVKGGFIFKKGEWYVEVDNNGKKKIYEKSIGKGATLKLNHLNNPILLTYKKWAQILKR